MVANQILGTSGLTTLGANTNISVGENISDVSQNTGINLSTSNSNNVVELIYISLLITFH